MRRTALALAAALFTPFALADEVPDWQANLEFALDDTKISISATNTPVPEILATVRDEGHVEVLLDPGAGAGESRLTLEMSDMSLRAILEFVAALSGLAFKPSCGSIVVSTPERLEQFPDDAPRVPEQADAADGAVYRALAETTEAVEIAKQPFRPAIEGFARERGIALAMAEFEALEVRISAKGLEVGQVLSLLAAQAGARIEVRAGAVAVEPLMH